MTFFTLIMNKRYVFNVKMSFISSFLKSGVSIGCAFACVPNKQFSKYETNTVG